jgi:N-carbamoyl-L-amino-acid hydrolase
MLSRRQMLAQTVTALALPLRARAQSDSTRRVSLDAPRLRQRLERLSTFGRPEGGTFANGVSRVAYSPADVAAREWLIGEMRNAGMAPRIDAAGNVFGRWGGERPDLPPILFGSHIDSVPNGGNFDGDLGSLASLGVIEAVQSARLTTRRPLEMVVWAHEESTAFGHGTAASRIVAGDLKAGTLDQVWSGFTRAEGIRRLGGDPSRLEQAIRPAGSWHAYLELHIEQGASLDRSRTPVGIVEGIVAIHRYDIVVKGFANHAGTTPMSERQDALVAASRVVLGVREEVAARPGRHVGTVGRLEVSPNSPNVIPGEVMLSAEFRDLSETTLRALAEGVRARLAGIAEQTGTTIAMTLASSNPAALATTAVQGAIARAAEREGLDARSLPSGAGHDAQMIARLAPMGMIFVPSIGGVSHSPLERTSWEDCAAGARVLLSAVLDLDGHDRIA